MNKCTLVVLMLYFFTSNLSSVFVSSSNITYEVLYKAGVDAYLQNRWYDCITLLEKSLEDYFFYTSVIVQCGKQCPLKDTRFPDGSKTVHRLETWYLFEVAVTKAQCLMKCEKTYFPERVEISKATQRDFEQKVPYDYLQLCYFKTDNAEKAASCAYTFLIHNPDHEVMQTNLRYYMAIPDIDPKKVKYLESKDYQEFYLKAAHLYTEKKFEDSIELMERSLQEYLSAEDECRLLCEGPMPVSVDAGFYVTVAILRGTESIVTVKNNVLKLSRINKDHFTFTLRCKLNCAEKLSYMYGQRHENLFSSHYHYLQFSYYKTKNFKKACEAVASFLILHFDDKVMIANRNFYSQLKGVKSEWFSPRQKACEAVASFLILHPDDKVMIANRNFYSQLKGVNTEWFSPRQEAVEYNKRHEEELNMLKFIEESFRFNKLQNAVSTPTPPPGSSVPYNIAPGLSLGKKRKKLAPKDLTDWFKSSGISTSLNDAELNGTSRVALDGLASTEECERLVHLASDGAVHGDGYNGRESPHTEFEMFEGLTVARAATLSQRGILDPFVAQLFLNISEKARHAVETYFNLDTELFFAYTHLVCRTALPDSPDVRMDLSHPVHADNCVLTPNGECLKQQPAYTWRDYSSIVYLNDDFEGGEFIFAKDKNTIQASVKPKCGLMVAFSAGKENLHGVKAVKKGRRCALAMWYTLDPKHQERERDFAKKILNDLVEKRKLLRSRDDEHDKVGKHEHSSLYRFVSDKSTSKIDVGNAAGEPEELSKGHHHVDL